MAVNQFLPWAVDPSAAVESQAAYQAEAPVGRGPGILPKESYNKVLRQATSIAAAVGEFIKASGADALDDGNIPALVLALTNAIQSGSAPTPIKAWVNFDGTPPVPSIRAALNVSSITRNATSDYTLHFTVAIADANYLVNGTCCASPSTQLNVNIHATGGTNTGGPATLMTTTALRIAVVGSGGTVDSSVICVNIVR